jgi:hypothetical protein
MRITDKYLIIIFLTTAIFSSCKKKSSVIAEPPDTTKPTITITQPTAGQAFVTGNTIAFQATFSDNKELKSYEVTVSKVVTSGMILKIVPLVVPFSYPKSGISFGKGTFGTGVKQQDITLSDIVIPLHTATEIVATGKYNVKVTCTDTANNTAETILEININ